MDGNLVEEMKARLHRVVNHLQVVISYIEMNRYSDAVDQTKLAVAELRFVDKILKNMTVIVTPEHHVAVVLPKELASKTEIVAIDSPKGIAIVRKE